MLVDRFLQILHYKWSILLYMGQAQFYRLIDQLIIQLNLLKSDNDYWYIHPTPQTFRALPDGLGQ